MVHDEVKLLKIVEYLTPAIEHVNQDIARLLGRYHVPYMELKFWHRVQFWSIIIGAMIIIVFAGWLIAGITIAFLVALWNAVPGFVLLSAFFIATVGLLSWFVKGSKQ